MAELRGFLFKTEEGEWLLVDTPNLKSCCVTSLDRKITLLGDFSAYKENTLLQVKGNLLHIKEKHYVLSDTAVVQTKKQGISGAIIGMVFLSLVGAILLKKVR